MNMAHGPDKDEGMRYDQFQECLKEVFAEMTPHTAALFRARSSNMA